MLEHSIIYLSLKSESTRGPKSSPFTRKIWINGIQWGHTAIECKLDRVSVLMNYEHVPAPNDLIYSDLTISKHQYELIGNAWLTLAPTLSSTYLHLMGLPLQNGMLLWIMVTRSHYRPFWLVDFVFPIQIMWRYPGEYFLSKLDILMLTRSLFNEHDKGSNLLGIIT